MINSKSEVGYQLCFSQFRDILSSYGEYDLQLEKITTDFELALFDTLSKIFSKSHIIGCYYHFNATLFRKARELGYIKKNNKAEPKKLISRLGQLPLLYDGTDIYFDNYVEIEKNYFIKNILII